MQFWLEQYFVHHLLTMGSLLNKINGGAGALFITKNYTGDVLLFDMLEQEAEDLGIPVRKILVTDDVAVETREGTTGRRGVADCL